MVPDRHRRAGSRGRAAGRRSPSDHGASPAQLALAWLLRRSPVLLPIPGTSTVAHLEENVAAAEIELSDDEYAAIDSAATAAA